jgi:hypothetical protein
MTDTNLYTDAPPPLRLTDAIRRIPVDKSRLFTPDEGEAGSIRTLIARLKRREGGDFATHAEAAGLRVWRLA